jgi:hypothetical protein
LKSEKHLDRNVAPLRFQQNLRGCLLFFLPSIYTGVIITIRVA